MARPFAVVVIVFALIASGALFARVPAQQQAPVQTELLTEVRLLRQAIESLAGTNARVQIVFGRLQLQDQRTEAAAKRLDAARDALNGMNNRIRQMSDMVKHAENALNDTNSKPEQIKQLQGELLGATRELERLEVERARLSTEEADAASILNQEQGRWSDLNRQLEELERALTRRQ